ASDSGGIPEVVQDGVTGLLFPVGHVERIARGCVELLLNGERWRDMSSRAAERAGGCFSAGRIVGVYEDYYDSVMAGGTCSGGAGCD
ncbi:glycosyltransferase, partial [Candidatus Fermentibacterales bacterium]|nr:glycosyltransferase [Candidatus Fermentibacterales bacterium]